MKYKFLDKGANLQGKGLVINQDYEVSAPVMHSSGVNIVSITIPGAEKPLVIKESTLNLEFALVSAQAPPVQQAMFQQPPVQQTPLQQQAPPAATERIVIKKEENDILLAGIQRLDFQSLNIKLLKIEGKLSMVIILDGMPPLAINSGDMSAKGIVDQILATFSENALIVATIREWNKSIKELQVEKEAEVKKLKAEKETAEKAAKAANGKKPNTAGIGVQKEKSAEVVHTDIPGEEISNEELEEELAADPIEDAPMGNLSGLSDNVGAFELV